MARELATPVGGAFITLEEDTEFTYEIDPGGAGLEVKVLGPMELGIGMTTSTLVRWQALCAEALAAAYRAQAEHVDGS